MSIQRVIVFGVGAAGSNVLLNLVASNPGLDYVAVDFDVVEQRNVDAHTQNFTRADLGRPKVQAIQRIVQQQFAKRIETHNIRVTTASDVLQTGANSTGLVIDCLDNAVSRNLLHRLRSHYDILHVGFSGQLTGEAVWDGVWTNMAESKSDKAIDVCQLPLARPFIMALTGAAALVASHFISTGEKRNVYFDARPAMRTY
jgi:hypothetical protein